jgi:hypothetical protein
LKASAAAFLLAAALSGAAGAQDAPSEVTDNEIARYKATAQQGCRESGMARGDPQAKIDAVCSCVLESFEKNLKRTEWQQAYFYALRKQEQQEQAVFDPHRGRLEACRQP